MFYARLFLLSLILTVCGMSIFFYVNRVAPRRAAPALVQIADGIFITSQIGIDQMRSLRGKGVRTIVDIRPDGEAADQAPSREIELASKQNGIIFHYVPVPHETIPDEAVTSVSKVISAEEKPVLLYCRSGRRAVRTFALAQASQADGPDAETILAMVKNAGFSAEDLKENITERIAHRTSLSAENRN